MRDNTSYVLVFLGGLLLGAMLTGGLFGSYVMFGAARSREEAVMIREMEMRARMDAEVARKEADHQRMIAEKARQDAEQRLRELEAAKQKP